MILSVIRFISVYSETKRAVYKFHYSFCDVNRDCKTGQMHTDNVYFEINRPLGRFFRNMLDLTYSENSI